MPSKETYIQKSDYEYYKSFGGWVGFMHSFGLKPTDSDDVEEGRSILEGFKKVDRMEWEEEQSKKSGKK